VRSESFAVYVISCTQIRVPAQEDAYEEHRTQRRRSADRGGGPSRRPKTPPSTSSSFQEVQECLNTVLRRAEVPLDVVDALAWLDTVLVPLVRVALTPALYQRGLDVQERWK